ncbi:MAG: ATP-binding cassette domain-containing protein, partial [Vicinamibacteria bacterium]
MEQGSSNASKTMIEAQGLTKYYGPFIAVENISFSIPEGQIVAFLGPNGAGKTTTMKMLTGFLAPSAGAARIAGLDVHQERIEASKRLGYLPENGPLYPDMTPLELLEFFGEARELAPQKLKERIAAVRGLCALEQVMDKPIGKLSRGMRQRVGLAQALLHDPEVLVMDEPTAGLDPNQIRHFRENIKKLGRSKTILISTHILHEADAIADYVLFVHNGRLVFEGTPAELKERIGAVRELCALEQVMEKPIGKLSRGMRQRVGLAQALLHDPEVLVMDEPTAGLDPNQIRHFRENIKKLGRSKTILISTHILQEADAI